MIRVLAVILYFLLCSSFTPLTNEEKLAIHLMEHLSVRYPKTPFGSFIYVAVKRQQLFLITSGKIVCRYSVSTSRYGTGSELNSEKTPLGLHRVQSKTGDRVPAGGIIKGTSYTGKNAKIETEAVSTGRDEITTRAIRLEGKENGLNKGGKIDSFNREIYIHGTPEEGLIGSPASHGCVRMKNADVIDLYDRVKEGMLVVILNN